MFKYLIAAAVALTPTVANAQTVVLDLNRSTLIKEAAKTICRAGMETKGSAVKAVERESAYLDLNRDEKLYLMTLCVLYAQGMVDGMKSR